MIITPCKCSIRRETATNWPSLRGWRRGLAGRFFRQRGSGSGCGMGAEASTAGMSSKTMLSEIHKAAAAASRWERPASTCVGASRDLPPPASVAGGVVGVLEADLGAAVLPPAQLRRLGLPRMLRRCALGHQDRELALGAGHFAAHLAAGHAQQLLADRAVKTDRHGFDRQPARGPARSDPRCQKTWCKKTKAYPSRRTRPQRPRPRPGAPGHFYSR